MKIKLLITSAITLISFGLVAQNYAYDSIQPNSLKIILNSDGVIHHNDDYTISSEFPKNSGLKTIYLQQLWMGGVDESSTLRLAANTYRQTGQDYWPGPVANNYSTAYDQNYNKVWHLLKTDIESHRDNYTDNGYIVPDVIADWPANGDVANGEAQNLAPYEDLNNNNIYEPELGDFPLIRGDEALFVIYNEMKSSHTETGGDKIGVEIHHMLYAYNNNGNESNDNTYYSHYEIFNRGTHTYADYWVTNWLDVDLGHYDDDYIQTDVARNLLMTYNGDSLDENGYGLNPPAFGFVTLNEELDYSMTYSNSQDASEGNPIFANDYKNFMIAKWKNGNPLLNLDGNISNYIFTGNSVNDSIPWSESTAGNIPADRRLLGTTVFYNFTPGTSICLDFASVFAHDTTLGPQNQLGHLQDLVDEVQTFYDNQYDNCQDVSDLGVGDDIEINGSQLSLINDNGQLYLTSDNLFGEDFNLDIYDVLGRSRGQWKLNSESNEQLIPTDKLTKGVYFITLTHKKERQSIKFSVY